MELKNLILIENGKSKGFDNLEDLIRELLGSNYYNLGKEEKMELMELNAKAKVLNSEHNVVILNNENKSKISVDNNFVVYDEITYVLSSLLVKRYFILEKESCNIFTKDLDKTDTKNETEYIILNTFAKELLKKYIDKIEI